MYLRVHFFNNVPKPFIFLQISHILVHNHKLLNFENLGSFWCALSVGQPTWPVSEATACLWCFLFTQADYERREWQDKLEMVSLWCETSTWLTSSHSLKGRCFWRHPGWNEAKTRPSSWKKCETTLFLFPFQPVDFSFVVFVWSGPRFKSLHIWTRMWLICKYLVRCWKNGLLRVHVFNSVQDISNILQSGEVDPDLASKTLERFAWSCSVPVYSHFVLLFLRQNRNFEKTFFAEFVTWNNLKKQRCSKQWDGPWKY